jgi:type IV pilus assembly protein PilQ
MLKNKILLFFVLITLILQNTVFAIDLNKNISLNFKNAEIKDVITAIAKEAGINIVIANGINGTISIYLDNVTLKSALKNITKSNGLSYSVEDNLIYIDKSDAIRNKDDMENYFYKPINIDIGELSEILKNYLSENGKIVEDKSGGVLIITDGTAKIEEIKEIIKKLDTPVKQIHIRTKIVETYRGANRALGIQWGGTYNDTTSYDFPYHVNVGGDSESGYLVNLPIAEPTSMISLGLANYAGSLIINAKLMAMQERGDAKVVSEPSVVTMNNQKAIIESGVEFKYRVIEEDNNQIQDDEAKLRMEVTPQVTPDGKIIVKIVVNKDELDFTREVDGYPLKQTRRAETILKLEDGETTIIGGLTKDTFSTKKQAVPFFSSIPLIGGLFKNTTKRKEYDEIMIFITPSIVSE